MPRPSEAEKPSRTRSALYGVHLNTAAAMETDKLKHLIVEWEDIYSMTDLKGIKLGCL